jgi:hypothetical protein
MDCTCWHEWQDERYGKGGRVHNEGEDEWVCTVCGRRVAKRGVVKAEKKGEEKVGRKEGV